MKIITKILIKTLKHDKHVDVREYLQEKLDNDKLTEKQVRYLIKNMNTNIYMLQNVYPVAEAMEKGISIDVIEECASLLDDALDLSIFALENGKGQLYNKVPYDLEHLLALSSVFYYSSFKKFEDGVTMGKLFNEIQRITQCFHQSRELKTISSELFWELVENSVYDIQRINNYNATVIEYLSEDNQKHVFTIDEFFSLGMNLFEIESFKYNNLEYLLERLENVKKIMSNDCHIESVEFKKDDKYILKVIKTCQPTYENINGQIEEVLKEVPSCLFYNPTCEEDYILDTDNKFILQLAVFTHGCYALDKQIYYTKEYEELKQKEIQHIKECEEQKQKEREKLSINGKYIPDIMNTLESHVWSNDGYENYTIQIGENIIKMRGYIYEPSWESFGTASSISLNGQCLYGKDSHNVGSYHNEVYSTGKFETLEEAIQYIKNETEK